MSVSRLNSWLSSHRSINQFWLLIINWLLIIDPSDVINQFLKRLFINQTKPFRRGGKWDTSGCFSVFCLSLIRVPHGELAAGWGADLHAYTHAHAAGARHGRAILWLEAVERGRWEGFGRLGLLAGKKLQSPSALLPVQGLGLVLLRGQVLVEKPPQGTSAPRCLGVVPLLVFESTPGIHQPMGVCQATCTSARKRPGLFLAPEMFSPTVLVLATA